MSSLIAVDTTSLVAYLSGAVGAEVAALAVAMEHAQAVLPPVVVTELLSDPKVHRSVKDLAQSCLDHDVALVPRDSDFHHFVRLAGMRLLVEPSR